MAAGVEKEPPGSFSYYCCCVCTLRPKGIQSMRSSQDFMWLAFGVAALLLALALAAVLIRLRGTLGAVEELLDTTNEELKETLPEVRQTIGNVNDITAGVNVGLRTAGGGAAARGGAPNAPPPCAWRWRERA